MPFQKDEKENYKIKKLDRDLFWTIKNFIMIKLKIHFIIFIYNNYTCVNYCGSILPHTTYSDPVLQHSYSGNSDTIKSCIFNPAK